MFAPLRSPTTTHTTKNMYATNGLIAALFFIFQDFCAKPHGVPSRRFAPPPSAYV